MTTYVSKIRLTVIAMAIDRWPIRIKFIERKWERGHISVFYNYRYFFRNGLSWFLSYKFWDITKTIISNGPTPLFASHESKKEQWSVGEEEEERTSICRSLLGPHCLGHRSGQGLQHRGEEPHQEARSIVATFNEVIKMLFPCGVQVLHLRQSRQLL